MLYTRFTQVILGLQEVIVTNIEKEPFILCLQIPERD